MMSAARFILAPNFLSFNFSNSFRGNIRPNALLYRVKRTKKLVKFSPLHACTSGIGSMKRVMQRDDNTTGELLRRSREGSPSRA